MKTLTLVVALWVASVAAFAQTNCNATAPTLQNNPTTLCFGDQLPAPVLTDSGSVLPDLAYMLVNNTKQLGGSPMIIDANSTGVFDPFTYEQVYNGDEVCVVAVRFQIEQVRNLVEGIMNGSYTAGTPCCNLIEALLDGVCEELDAQGVTGASSVVGLAEILNVVEVLYGEALSVSSFMGTIDLLNTQGVFLPTECGGGSVNIPICFAVYANALSCHTVGYAVSGTETVYINTNAANGSVNLSANGTGPFSYTWSNSNTGATQNGLAVGTYNVTVVDGNNCSVVETIEVLDSCALLTYELELVPVSCNGGSDALALIKPQDGTADYVVSSTSGADQNVTTGGSASYFSLAAGNYSYTITDDKGCASNVSFALNDPEPVFVAIETLPDTLDLNITDTLSFELDTMYGGDLPINLTWDFENGSSTTYSEGTVTYSTPGNYEVSLTARDTRNCTYTVTHDLVVIGTTSVDEVTEVESYNVYPNPSKGMFFMDMKLSEVSIFRVFDLSGKQVFEGNVELQGSTVIDLKNLESGVYYLQVEGASHKTKLVVLK